MPSRAAEELPQQQCGSSQPQEPSLSMAHDVLWLSIRSDHPDEIAVHMEDGRNPDGSEAGNTGSSTWPCSCRASPSLVSPLGLASFGSQANNLCGQVSSQFITVFASTAPECTTCMVVCKGCRSKIGIQRGWLRI